MKYSWLNFMTYENHEMSSIICKILEMSLIQLYFELNRPYSGMKFQDWTGSGSKLKLNCEAMTFEVLKLCPEKIKNQESCDVWLVLSSNVQWCNELYTKERYVQFNG